MKDQKSMIKLLLNEACKKNKKGSKKIADKGIVTNFEGA